jgi:hypothetical protein
MKRQKETCMFATHTHGCLTAGHVDGVLATWATTIVNNYRFGCPANPDARMQLTMARTNESGNALYPEADALEGLGIDIHVVAAGLETGKLTPEVVGEVATSVASGNLSADDANTGFAHLVEDDDAACSHPGDLLEQQLHRRELCSCWE